MSDNKILVSVLVPNYNHASFLDKRIESILSQTFQNFELIILDDASKDFSCDIIEIYSKHPKVSHIILNKINSGSPFGMWDKGFKLAKGKYIWIAESDDFSEDIFLETLVKKFENSEVVVSHCKSYDTNSSGKHIQENTWWNTIEPNIWDSDYIIGGVKLLNFYGKYKCPVINVSSALLRKSILNKVEIPIKYKYCGDWWFWGQVFQLGLVAYTSTPYNYIRNHSNSATGKNNSNNFKRIIENFDVIKNISKDLKQKLHYNKNYDWLIQFLVGETSKNRNFFKVKYLFPKIPISFRLVYYKKLIILLCVKVINKIIK